MIENKLFKMNRLDNRKHIILDIFNPESKYKFDVVKFDNSISLILRLKRNKSLQFVITRTGKITYGFLGKPNEIFRAFEIEFRNLNRCKKHVEKWLKE